MTLNWLFPTALTALICTASVTVASDRALLIGISDYGGGMGLVGPPNDVAIVRTALIQHMGFRDGDILALSQEQSTKTGITNAVQSWLANGTNPGDRVFIYFSGHGTQVPDQDHDEGDEGKDEAIVMVDYGPDDPLDGLLTDDEIAVLLDRLSGRYVTMVVDACHSGSVHRALSLEYDTDPTARFFPPYPVSGAPASRAVLSDATTAQKADALRRDPTFGQEIEDPTREIWTAASSYQLAWEDKSSGQNQGVFTRAFVEAMEDPRADANGNGTLSRGELLAYVQNRTESFCDASPLCRAENTGFTPTLTVEPGARGLAVAAWPESASANATSPDTSGTAPSVDQMLDVLVGGGTPAELRIVHAERDKTGPIRAGDRVRFEISSQDAGQVILLDLRDGGVVHQLFPSSRMGDVAPVTPGRPLVIPDAYAGVEFRLPPGEGALVAVVVNDPGLIEDLSRRNMSMQTISEPTVLFGELMENLTGVWSGDQENRSVRFGIAQLKYRAE